MENDNSKNANSEDEMVVKKSKDTETIIFGLIGLVSGIVSFFPLAYWFAGIGFEYGISKRNLNTNIDDFLLIFFCAIPAWILSTLLGIAGGKKCVMWNKYIGTILGGILGSAIILSLLTIYIIWGWRK